MLLLEVTVVMLFCLYCICFTSGLWSSPVVTGTTPPPCKDFSFLKVRNSTVVLFGGFNMKRYSDQLYTLDLNNMVRNM